MKYIVIVTCAITVLVSGCTKNNQVSETRLNERLPPDSTGISNPAYSGDFVNGPYGSVNGNAKVYYQGGKLILSLENVTISNGPDLHVYISQEMQPINFIDLGKLKSTNGNQLYDIPQMPDFTIYKYALIHCQQYNHLFGSAALQ